MKQVFRCYVMLYDNDARTEELLMTMDKHGYEPYNSYRVPGKVYMMYLFHLHGAEMIQVITKLLLDRTIVRYVLDHEDMPLNWGDDTEIMVQNCDEGDMVRTWNGAVGRVAKPQHENGHIQHYMISEIGNYWALKPTDMVTRLQTKEQILQRAVSLGL